LLINYNIENIKWERKTIWEKSGKIGCIRTLLTEEISEMPLGNFNNQHKPDLFRVSYGEIENYGITGGQYQFFIGTIQ
jgi:hypothetical protein